MMLSYLLLLVGSMRWLFLFHRIPIGFSPFASHWRTEGSPRLAVWLRSLISKVGGAKRIKKYVKIQLASSGKKFGRQN